jgi:hypothetical protein
MLNHRWTAIPITPDFRRRRPGPPACRPMAIEVAARPARAPKDGVLARIARHGFANVGRAILFGLPFGEHSSVTSARKRYEKDRHMRWLHDHFSTRAEGGNSAPLEIELDRSDSRSPILGRKLKSATTYTLEVGVR